MLNTQRVRKGFTLIELLVVIAIIAVLAAILFPVFAQARAKARQAVCVSNLKQIGTAVMMYVQDYDETFPTSWAKGWVGDPNFFVQPYMKSTKILLCPERHVSTTSAAVAPCMSGGDSYGQYYLQAGGRDNPTGETDLWGYGWNMGANWDDGDGLFLPSDKDPHTDGHAVNITFNGVTVTANLRPTVKAGKTLAQVVSPGSTFMEADTNEPPFQSMQLDAMRPLDANYPGHTNSPCEKAIRDPHPRHNGGYVYLFADGHSKWLKYDGTVTNAGSEFAGEPANVSNLCMYYANWDGSSKTVTESSSPDSVAPGSVTNCGTFGN